MRIAFFVHRFPVVSETFVLRQITGLIDLGHEVDIYSERSPEAGEPIHPEFEKYKLHERTTYLDAKMPPASGYWSMPVWPITGETWLPGSEHPIRNFDRIMEAIPTLQFCLTKAPEITIQMLDPEQYGDQAVSLESVYHLHSLLHRKGDYDVLHAHFGPVGNSFRFARTLWNSPLVVSFHGYDLSPAPRQNGSNGYRHLFQTVDRVTVNSEYTRGRVEVLGCPPERIRKVSVGLNPDDFPFSERRPDLAGDVRILTVARLVEIKGVEYAIRAVAKLARVYPAVRYDVVGDGPLRQDLQALIAELGLNRIVTLHGALAGDNVRQMMAKSHLFMITSVNIDGAQEGQGLVLQEAQASGLPVVATRHGAFPEGIVPDQSGFLVPERDPELLAERLAWLIEHPENWPAIGRAGRELVERAYDIRCLNRILLKVYEEAIEAF